MLPQASADAEVVSVSNMDADDGKTDGGEAVEQVEPPPADRRNELAADMIHRRGEELAVHQQALAMTRSALQEAAKTVTCPHTVQEMREIASRQLPDINMDGADSRNEV